MKVGIITIATGAYIDFLPAFLSSVQAKFLAGHDRHIFVLTDNPQTVETSAAVHPLLVPKLKWPMSTMSRFGWITTYENCFKIFDYLFFVDSDMIVQGEVAGEVLRERMVGVHHPTYFGTEQGCFDHNNKSSSYLPDEYRGAYLQGCFFGGPAVEFMQMSRLLANNIIGDLTQGVIALWHDESHLNWYFAKFPPYVLSPSYAYPEHSDLPLEKKIIHLAKDHRVIREQDRTVKEWLMVYRTRLALRTRLMSLIGK